MSLMAKEKRKASSAKHSAVDSRVAPLLGRITDDKQELTFRKNENIFRRGEPADSIYFVQSGRVKITVVSTAVREAVLAMPGPHDVFGEASLVQQSLRVSTAKTLEPSTVFRVDRGAMIRALTSSPSSPKNS
jgi:CRP/FNR family cyclic AMP-dependent transcriptional regulator